MSTDAQTASDLVDRLHEFIGLYVDDRDGGSNPLPELVQGYPNEKRSLCIDYGDLAQWDQEFAIDLIEDPDEILPYLEEAVATYPRYPVPSLPSNFRPDIRITGIERIPDVHHFPVGKYSTQRVDDEPFTVISGQVQRVTQVRGFATELVFECVRCGVRTTVPQHDVEKREEPHECHGCERQGPFRTVDDESEDFQLMRLQQPPEESTGGSQPPTIDVRMFGDNVDNVTPGDRVNAATILEKDYDDDAPLFDVAAKANHVETQETDFEDIDYSEDLEEIKEIANSENPHQLVIDSIKPSHRGDANVKEAIALQMFGGVTKELSDGSRKRGQSHILLVGDPGTDKSGLLSRAAQLSPRSVQTSGKNTTSAGLTCAAVQTDFGDGGWTIEAGALVEATGGLCAIDEFDKVDEEDRKGANQAMAEGKITPAKAGIKNIELPARTKVIAAANPIHGRFDRNQPIGDQIDFDPTIFSRFDLIFTFSDQPNEEMDKELADHILETHQQGAKRERGEDAAASSESTPEIEPELLRSYIAYAQQECTPVLSDDARERLREFYVDIRSRGESSDSPVPTTARKLDALVRLAEASARIRLDETVRVKDAERVIELVLDSLKQVGVDPETGQFDADVVETGTTKTQRDRITMVKNYIEELELEHEDGAPIEEVLDLAEEKYSRTKVIGDIDKLKEEGQAYEPIESHIRLT
jgi:replicative DNA helicase Mcm